MKYTLSEMREHVKSLAAERGIRLINLSKFSSEFSGFKSHRSLPIVNVPHFKTALDYATILHEIGHQIYSKNWEGQLDKEENIIAHEKEAWDYARQTALEWTNEMEAHAQMCLKTYTLHYEIKELIKVRDYKTAIKLYRESRVLNALLTLGDE